LKSLYPAKKRTENEKFRLRELGKIKRGRKEAKVRGWAGCGAGTRGQGNWGTQVCVREINPRRPNVRVSKKKARSEEVPP